MFTIYGGKTEFNQWEQGQMITNPNMAVGDKVRFWNASGETHPMIAYKHDGVVVVDVPNDLLQRASPVLVDLCGKPEYLTRFMVNFVSHKEPEGYQFIDNTHCDPVGASNCVPDDFFISDSKKRINPWYITDMYHEEVVEKVLVEDRVVVSRNQGGVNFGMIEVAVNDTIERFLNDMMSGKTIDCRVGFDGTTYDVKYSGTKPGVFGNLGLLPNEGHEDTGEPFVIGVDYGVFMVYTKTAGEHTIGLSLLETVAHQVPIKYLPIDEIKVALGLS